MPHAPLSPCPVPRCPRLTAGGRCAEHRTQQRRQSDDQRGTAQQRGYTWTWHKARTAYLLEHPLCMDCHDDGCIVSATVVDHVIPHKGDARLMWAVSNWRALCKRHHDRKTARHDGGFGHVRCST